MEVQSLAVLGYVYFIEIKFEYLANLFSTLQILTAGHCTFAEQPSDFIIAAGSNRLSEVTTYNVTRYM